MLTQERSLAKGNSSRTGGDAGVDEDAQVIMVVPSHCPAMRTAASIGNTFEETPARTSVRTATKPSDFGDAKQRANRTGKRGKRGAISPGNDWTRR
jgi:hypothetical protein